MKKVVTTEKILLEFDPETKNLLPAIKNINTSFGFVSLADAQKVAEYFCLPLSKVYQTASFYDEINVKKPVEIVIEICGSINCASKKSYDIVKAVENYFHVKAGDDNKKVRIKIISCVGKCGEGPILILNGKEYTQVSASIVHGILEQL